MAVPYDIKSITPQEQDAFYADFVSEKSFLQTSRYGLWRETLNEKNFRVGIFRDSQCVGIAQYQKINARRGRYLHVPHGPLILPEHCEGGGEAFLTYLQQEGKQLGCDFVRVSPLWGADMGGAFSALKYRPAPVHMVNPERTWVLDISGTEDAILAQMRKSTRYEVRRIEKVGISVQMGNTRGDLDIFWRLHEATVKRQGFVPFSLTSTQRELEVFGEDIQIFSASVEQKYYSSSIIWFDAHAAYYHQGASEYSKLPVAHATLWAAILEAKRRGCREFNFWGVSPEDEPKHPWAGLSRFKRGFGGEERVYLHAKDYPLTSKYWLNYAVERYRRWKRGY